MKLLLDTHAIIWWAAGSANIGQTLRAAVVDPANDIYVSAASAWEMAIKERSGKLPLPPSLSNRFEPTMGQAGWNILLITSSHGFSAARLSRFHKDPFDRMLVAQALAEGMTLATRDLHLARYGVPTLW